MLILILYCRLPALLLTTSILYMACLWIPTTTFAFYLRYLFFFLNPLSLSLSLSLSLFVSLLDFCLVSEKWLELNTYMKSFWVFFFKFIYLVCF